MTKNLMSLALSADDLDAVDAALTTLEARLAGLIALRVDERRELAKMGDKSEAFCRQTLTILVQNPQIVPPSFDLDEAQADLAAVDVLRPRLARLRRLTERAEDSEMALGSDVMRAALEGYALLKVSGRNQGLEGLRQGLSARFGRTARRAEPPASVEG
jgi:hypothetical protein